VANKRPSQKSFAERSDDSLEEPPEPSDDEALIDPADIHFRWDKTDKTSLKA
jgi:hypothetical protein